MSSTQIIFTDNVEKYRKLVLEELKAFNIHCMGEAANGLELLRLLKEQHPEVVLLDLEMPVMDGNKALNEIMQLFPETKVIILSMHYESLLVEDYIRRGAKGYLPKDEIAGDISLLAKAIEALEWFWEENCSANQTQTKFIFPNHPWSLLWVIIY